MVGLATQNRERPVDLLDHHDPRELMREGDGTQRESPPGGPDQGFIDPERAADDQGKALRWTLEGLVQEFGEGRRVDRLGHAVEDDERPVPQRTFDALPLAAKNLSGGTPVQGLIPDLDDLEAGLPRDTTLVLGARLRERTPRTADDDEPERPSVPVVALARLGQLADSLSRGPLLEVVLHGVEQLAHEPWREIHPGHDHTGDLLLVDLVVDPGERDGELVVGVRDVREVGVVPRHLLRREVDVEVALAVVVRFHGFSIRAAAQGRRR